MTVIPLLIVAGGSVALGFLAAFAWAVRSGQFDDTSSPPWRILLDERGHRAARPDSDSSQKDALHGSGSR